MDQGSQAASTRNPVTRGYLVQGRVQGVGFRYFVLRHAIDLGVCGWVRNLASGEVEVQATGTADQLARLETALRRGPRFSSVTLVTVHELPPGPQTGFAIVD